MTVLRHPTADLEPVAPLAIEPVVVAFPDEGDALVPVYRDGRLTGAFVRSNGSVRYLPTVDPGRVASVATAIAALAVAGAAFAAARRAPAVGSVTMGPGGWVSFKGVAAPRLRPADNRPWWARMLRARRLVVR